jgi:hypothetical protein
MTVHLILNLAWMLVLSSVYELNLTKKSPGFFSGNSQKMQTRQLKLQKYLCKGSQEGMIDMASKVNT